jgi:membrane protease YdiL (CAAX protease family)
MPAEELAPLTIPAPELTSQQSSLPAPLPPATKRGIAPIWHTAVLILVILAFSLWGGLRTAGSGSEPLAALKGSRIIHYGLSAVFELLLVAWVAVGLRLRKIPIRSLFGELPRGLNNVTLELGVSAAFWICSMFVLMSFALTWNLVQTQVYRHQVKLHEQQHAEHKAQEAQGGTTAPEAPTPKSPQQQQTEMARKLMEMAPSGGLEIAAWGVLCLIVGFSEEFVFRGYLQSQGILLLRSAVFGVLLSALVFGAAHGYQGIRGMCLITVYGALFSGITLFRRNLFPGMIAHGWHDFATGLALALIRETHLLDKLPTAS